MELKERTWTVFQQVTVKATVPSRAVEAARRLIRGTVQEEERFIVRDPELGETLAIRCKGGGIAFSPLPPD